MKKPIGFCLLGLTLLVIGCNGTKTPQYVVGVSQCSDDAWRTKMNAELNDELIFHPDLTLRYRQANDNSELQCLQIDSFISEGVDALIVSPNEALEVQPAVERAFAAGIPVVVADRRVPGNNWSAFVGGDNEQVGRLMAKWLNKTQQAKGGSIRVLEIVGLPGSTPAVLRHEGMMSTLRDNPDVQVVGQGCGMWFMDIAEQACDSLLSQYGEVDAIVAQNDLMARGAAQACARHNYKIPIMGVDGITGEGGGIEAILDGTICVTATYASRGDLVLQRTAQILHAEAFPRVTNLRSVLIARDEAEPLALMAEERATQVAAIEQLRHNLVSLNNSYANQRMVIWLLILVLILLLILGSFLYYLILYRARTREKQKKQEQLLDKQQKQLQEMSELLETSRRKIPTLEEEEKLFMAKLTVQIQEHLGDANLSVEVLADHMGMSRSVLFRRVKQATGQSPVELIRHLRLERAKKLLEVGTLSVQQVAYEVGFSAPGYFTKCYHEEYGENPGETKK